MEGTHTEGTYARRRHTHGGGINTEGETHEWDIHTEEVCTRRDVHTEGYRYGGEIQMKEQLNKETYTWRGHTRRGDMQKEGCTHGGTYT